MNQSIWYKFFLNHFNWLVTQIGQDERNSQELEFYVYRYGTVRTSGDQLQYLHKTREGRGNRFQPYLLQEARGTIE